MWQDPITLLWHVKVQFEFSSYILSYKTKERAQQFIDKFQSIPIIKPCYRYYPKIY